MDADFASQFAAEWIAAWNAHDLEQILSHYEDDFEMSSPVIRQLLGEASGTLKGKQAVGDYWQKALTLYPELRFELRATLVGANSVTLLYDGVKGLSAEVFHFGPAGKVTQAFAHYVPQAGA